jgi:hypothetical protein
MRLYVVLKSVLPNTDMRVVDSVWRNLNEAYDRMMALKDGGHIEFHVLKGNKGEK